jgi:PAS domain-containing protein
MLMFWKKDNGEIGVLKKRIAELELMQAECRKGEVIFTEATELAESIIDAMRDPLIVLDGALRVVLPNKAFYNTFAVTPPETLGKFIYDLGNRQWDIPRLRELLEAILPNNASFDNYVIEHEFQNIGRRVMVLNARRIPRPPAKPRIILLVIEDITDIDKMRMSYEKMLEFGLFSKVAKEKEESIVELRREVDALLVRLGEKLKYNNGTR